MPSWPLHILHPTKHRQEHTPTDRVQRLPNELYRPIINFIRDKGTLFNVLLVSRALHGDAERALYWAVDLTETEDTARHELFRLRVLSSSRLAAFVHELKLSVGTVMIAHTVSYKLGFDNRIALGQAISQVELMLKRMGNLQCLTLKHGGSVPIKGFTYGQLLEGTSFRLHFLDMHFVPYVEDYRFVSFFERQTELVDLRCEGSVTLLNPITIPFALAKLVSLEVQSNTALALLPHPGITHLKLRGGNAPLSQLFLLVPNLLVLVVSQVLPSNAGAFLPELRFLQCPVDPHTTPEGNKRVLRCIEGLSSLKRFRCSPIGGRFSEGYAAEWAKLLFQVRDTLEAVLQPFNNVAFTSKSQRTSDDVVFDESDVMPDVVWQRDLSRRVPPGGSSDWRTE